VFRRLTVVLNCFDGCEQEKVVLAVRGWFGGNLGCKVAVALVEAQNAKATGPAKLRHSTFVPADCWLSHLWELRSS